MDWAHPFFLYLILPVLAAWIGLSLYSRSRRLKAARTFVAPEMTSRILPPDSVARFGFKLFFQAGALLCGLLALAGPRYGIQEEQVIPRGSDLYVLLDVSRSMLAEDVPPSRLGRAKADVSALLNRLEGERIGLIAFAGQAVVKCPLTIDYDSFRRALAELDPGSAPRGGTAIGDAIRKALEVFDAQAGRDQSILLITDGDDQQSYPLEAAAIAAERQVAVFAVGLGDPDQGARIPQSGETRTFVEYQGEQVWSKLDGTLLEQIALKTSGVYVPAGTRAYDLGELYVDHLRGRRGNSDESRTRVRRAERFQIPLALTLFALLADLAIRRYPQVASTAPSAGLPVPGGQRPWRSVAPGGLALVCFALVSGLNDAWAAEPARTLREGLTHYGAGEFDKAQEKFATAREELDKTDAGRGAIATFDEACAAHRQGNGAQARELYLKAGLAHDRRLAAAAHFNLGTLTVEEVRKLAGEEPAAVPPEKRQEILDQLRGAVASFRHSLELQPDNPRARRDIELVRQWIKFYTDRWREVDRQKRRDETNLLKFLEFVVETQRGLRETVRQTTPTTTADAFAELRRLQLELKEEIPTLREKIDSELRPAPSTGGQPSPPPQDPQELEQGINLLKGWADSAETRMGGAAGHLAARNAESAAADQQSAIQELEQIWEAIVPFPTLLARDLAEQTQITHALAPAEPDTSHQESDQETPADEADEESPQSAPNPTASTASIADDSVDLARWTELQTATRRRTQLLQLKAQAELDRLEQASPRTGDPPQSEQEDVRDEPQSAGESPSTEVDPEEARAGFRKAIELAPQAVAQMDQALDQLQRKQRPLAYPPAEEARRLLQEIQDAQPKQKQEQPPQDKNQDNEQPPDQQKPDNQSSPDEKQPDEKPEDQNTSDSGKEQDEEQPPQSPPKDRESETGKKPQPQTSQDRVEEALRKVRERQDAKRDRDRKLKARVLGRTPVEKDW